MKAAVRDEQDEEEVRGRLSVETISSEEPQELDGVLKKGRAQFADLLSWQSVCASYWPPSRQTQGDWPIVAVAQIYPSDTFHLSNTSNWQWIEIKPKRFWKHTHCIRRLNSICRPPEWMFQFQGRKFEIREDGKGQIKKKNGAAYEVESYGRGKADCI